ncbi:MAG: hypothetical protein ACRDVE_18040 [Actinocrinis sp.]
MTIAERFAGRADGTEWRGTMQDQLDYRALAARLAEFPFDRNALCARNAYCILHWRHAGPCLAFMQLQNIPRDPTLPPPYQAL